MIAEADERFDVKAKTHDIVETEPGVFHTILEPCSVRVLVVAADRAHLERVLRSTEIEAGTRTGTLP